MRRAARKQAVYEIMQSGHGTLAALKDLLTGELECARQELEAAGSTQEMWRAQGKCQALRILLQHLKNGEGK